LLFLIKKFEYKEEVEKLYSFINKMDEFEFFQKMITGLKEKSFGFLQTVINLLPVETQNNLKDILSSKRVLIDEKDNISVPRKILKVSGIKKNQ